MDVNFLLEPFFSVLYTVFKLYGERHVATERGEAPPYPTFFNNALFPRYHYIQNVVTFTGKVRSIGLLPPFKTFVVNSNENVCIMNR